MKNIAELSLKELLSHRFQCSCGHEHKIEINNIIIEAGAINKIGKALENFRNKSVFLVQDINTYEVAGKQAIELLKENFILTCHTFEEKHLKADERALGSLLVTVPKDTEVILAVGSGTINDLCRFLAYKLNLPYVILGTAPSMDGYASIVSPLIVDGIKVTYNAIYPYAIVADIDIMKEAPMYMLQAGFGDILGKYTALADWNLAKLIKKEYFCDEIQTLVQKVIEKCVAEVDKIQSRDPKAIENITEALILSGLAIGMVGVSRPASGEEHHLSHCWEMMFMNSGEDTPWLHGNNVGVGVGIIAYAYEFLKHIDIEKVNSKGDYKRLEREAWEKSIKTAYGISGQGIIDFKVKSIAFDEDLREKNFQDIFAKWNEVRNICEKFLPKPEDIIKLLKTSGAIYHPRQLGFNEEKFKLSFIAAKDIRNRFGVLQLLEDIGMLEVAAEAITKIYYEEEI
jgi:glycerol-1-phosphate dehydrogenase [NAD(P)+]